MKFSAHIEAQSLTKFCANQWWRKFLSDGDGKGGGADWEYRISVGWGAHAF